MPLKFFTTQDEIPQDQRESAIALADGKFAVLEEAAPADLEAAGRRALDEERAGRKAAETARKAAEKERDDLRRAADARSRGVTEEELQRIRADEAAARKPIEDERDRLAAENRRLKHTDKVRALALKAGVMPDRIDDAMLTLEKRTDLDDSGGIIVLGKDGKATAESIDEFLSKTFKTEKPWFYRGSGASGSGSLGSDANPEDAPTAAAGQQHEQQVKRAAVLSGF
jgi:hypothetical protein